MPYVKIADQVRFAHEKMQKVSLFDSDHLFCDLYCLGPGQSQQPHQHATADKIYQVLEGRGRFVLGDESRELEAGHVVHAPPGSTHGVENAGNSKLILLVIMAPNPNRG